MALTYYQQIAALVGIDMQQSELENVKLHTVNTAGRPASPVLGQIIYNSETNLIEHWDCSQWSSHAGTLTEIQSLTTDQLTITNGTGPTASISIVTGAVTDVSTALATGAQIHSFVTSLGYLESLSKIK